ncbi:MAG: arsenite methyltransferase [Dehalococcoidia bacterium]|nr:arsenite methyltransferase [Dehalococcoidia bacterium]
MTQLDDVQIKEVVRERYGALARDSADSCCATDCCSDNGSEMDSIMTLYASDQTEGLPAEAIAASAGCGNPLAIGTLQAGETVVDFGSGGGIDCFIAAKAVGEQGRVVGIDMTEDMINLARSNARQLGLSNVEFHLSEMESTPLEGDSVDAIISNCVINLAPDKDLVFREAFRILRPGGRLMVSDLVKIEEIPQEEAEDTANWVSCLAGTEMKEVYLGRMKSAGFTDVQVTSSAPWREEGWQSNIHSMGISAVKPV